jgi:superfamily II RNA helicase
MDNFITRQSLDKQKLSIFFRDLSSESNVNLKHMIEDNTKHIVNNKGNKKQHHNKKSKNQKMKKKDIIIMEQNKIREEKNKQEDYRKIDYYMSSLNLTDPFSSIKKIKTEGGIIKFKKLLLDELWKNKNQYMHYILILYYELKADVTNTEINNDDDFKTLLKNIENTISKYDTKMFMMEKMGNLLPPLNYSQTTLKKFDEWQINVINMIHRKESVIVRAPTSSGKTFIAMAAGILHKKILYVCPAKPVAYQVGSNFINMGYKVHFLVDNISHHSYTAQTNIFVGTPKEIENNLNKIGVQYDYVVFDEIHNLNKKDDGNIYENIIKIVGCNFLALSATIKNIDFLKDLFKKLNPNHKINYVEYNKRFINHQRWIWDNNKLVKLHPLCVYKSINEMKDDSSLSFTPSDCAKIWNNIEDIFEEVIDETGDLDNCSPDDYFKNNDLLTLDNCKDYELFIKNKLISLNNTYEKEVGELFDSFSTNKTLKDNNDIINFIRKTKDKDMFPMLMFHTEEDKCKDIFNNIYNLLKDKELEDYPFHYDILEKKEELYQSYLNKREVFKSNIKITSGSTNAQFFIKEKMELYDKKEKTTYISNIISFYESKINEIKKNDYTDTIKEKQKKNIETEMNNFILNPDFSSQDIFQKHPDFIFTNSNEPMSGETIREVRREIKNTLGIKIPYESPLFQMLKRGIGLYIENAPDEYNWILQKLLTKKEIGIVISDKTLCLGIDLPVRTTCFLGIDNSIFTKDEYLQMSGRAGRRGKDTQGNVVFYGDIDYINLMKSSEPEIIGNTKPILENYKILKYNQSNNKIFENMINPERKYIEIDGFNVNEQYKDEKILWSLREYSGAIGFIKSLNKLESDLYRLNEDHDKYILLINKVSDLLNDTDKDEIITCYKMKKLSNYKLISKTKEYLTTIMNIHNYVKKDRHMIIARTCKVVFDDLNKMIFTLII